MFKVLDVIAACRVGSSGSGSVYTTSGPPAFVLPSALYRQCVMAARLQGKLRRTISARLCDVMATIVLLPGM